ncbi:unnamed protein product, partial [Heterosigma akashiwo]
HRAAFHGIIAVVELLLDRDANPNIQESRKKNTPLHYACQQGREDVVIMLLTKQTRHKLDLNLANSDQVSCYEAIFSSGVVEGISFILRKSHLGSPAGPGYGNAQQFCQHASKFESNISLKYVNLLVAD